MVLSLFALPSAAVSVHSDSMAVISQNIANVNTPGSKGSVVHFRPLLAETQGVESRLRGRHGLQTFERSDISRQGTPIVTGRRLDLAISGEGFFTLQNAAGDVAYTRNGSFRTLFDETAPAGADSFLGDASGDSGSFVPSDYALLEPWWRNALENPSAVQFEHRFLALLLLLGCFVLFVFLRQSSVRMDWHARGLLFLPLLQVLLGGFVLWWRVPVLLGVVHQVLGVFLVVGLFVLCWRLEVEGG